MKTSYFFILIFVFGFLFNSCTENLSFDDYNKLPQAEFWKTQADAEAALVSCYGDLSGWSFVDGSTLGPEQMASDNTAKGSTTGSQADMLAFADFSFTPSLARFNNLWTSRYSVVNKCNQVIKYVPDMTLDATTKNQILGEARFMRAWIYFELVRTFGEVVVYNGLPEGGAYNIAKSSIPEIYQFILDDLKFGYENMRKTAWETQWKGRVTAWSARALEAKVLMYMASGSNFMEDGQAILGKTWTDVKTVTDDVIQNSYYQLFNSKGDSSFYYLYRLENENCDESIFEVQNGASTTTGGINRSPYTLNTWVKAGRDGCYGYSVPSDDLVADWSARETAQNDKRYRFSVVFKGDILPDGDVVDGAAALEGITGTPRYNFKVYVPKNQQTKLGGWIKIIEQNQRLYRFAEVLLIDAEAELRLGNASAALTSLQAVRDRARETTYSVSDVTLENIWDERRFELAFENDRYFDLIRTGKADEVLGARGWIYPKNVFYPIPQTQIDLSGGTLVQNKHW